MICGSAYLAIRVLAAERADGDGVSAGVLGGDRLVSGRAEAIGHASRRGIRGPVGWALVTDARPAPESRAAGLARPIRSPIVTRCAVASVRRRALHWRERIGHTGGDGFASSAEAVGWALYASLGRSAIETRIACARV